MDKQLLNLERWDTLSPTECEAVAQELRQSLSVPWQFTGIEMHELGDQRHQVAFFDWNGAAFALIPGCEATLGYDRNNPFILDDVQQQDWNLLMEEWGALDFAEYMDIFMTPLRTVAIKPFLMEVEATEWKLRPIGTQLDTSEVSQVSCVSHRDMGQIISQDGFRFPTSDEWEYACTAGSRTLWRWGNNYPLHCYPKLCQDWDFNLKPNAFGLVIASYPYDWEFCAEPTIMRGGTVVLECAGATKSRGFGCL